MYNWASSNLKGIKTHFVGISVIKKMERKLRSRFGKAKLIAGTQAFHYFKPVFNSKSEIIVKRLSSSTNQEVRVIL